MNRFFIYLCLVVFILFLPGLYIIETGIHLINHSNETYQWANCTVESIIIKNISIDDNYDKKREVTYHLRVNIDFGDYYTDYIKNYSIDSRLIVPGKSFTCTIDYNYNLISLKEKPLPYHMFIDSFTAWFGAVIYYSLACILLILFPTLEYYRRLVEYPKDILTNNNYEKTLDKGKYHKGLKWEEGYNTSLLD